MASTASVARGSRGSEAISIGRHNVRSRSIATPVNTQLAITYPKATAVANATLIASKETALGATFLRSIDSTANTTTRIVSVPTKSVAQTESSFRAQAGVQSVAVTGLRRHTMSSVPYYGNDPYFNGFTAAQNNTAQGVSINTHQAPPYDEASNIPGQWDMHAIKLENAYGYSQAGSTLVGGANGLAIGSPTIKIAIIDTGEDYNHPELGGGKIGYQKCFVTNDAGTVQSTGVFTTDEDGHGTDVSGIAAATFNNGLGFTGAGGNSTIYAYRVFPTPDDTCVDGSVNQDDTCDSNTADIASAINDAVTHNVNVISMSLGGGDSTGNGCTSPGVDSDPIEGAAITRAINAGIIVVAAAGNSGPSSVLEAPACDSGVIAVGATGLTIGDATGTSPYTDNGLANLATTANPVEYVASYSQAGTANTLQSSSSWGIVAPGGDPSATEGTANSTSEDDLHWIENIWTTTPFDGNFAADQTNSGGIAPCTSDYASNGAPDCRTLIAGTSMATPHVAGAIALILAVKPSLQNPAAMKQLLCASADDLHDTRQGCGRLNVYRAMAMALNDPTP